MSLRRHADHELAAVVSICERLRRLLAVFSHVFDAVGNQLPDAGQRFIGRRRQLAFAVVPSASSQELTIGNGEQNSIIVDGMTRETRTFTFQQVTLAEPGWLVLHPFEDGEPQGEIYVGAKYLPAGTHESVTIKVQTAPEPEPGAQFIVMLHGDVDRDETFDFFFVDERNVADKAVFEGSTMIGHVIAAP